MTGSPFTPPTDTQGGRHGSRQAWEPASGLQSRRGLLGNRRPVSRGGTVGAPHDDDTDDGEHAAREGERGRSLAEPHPCEQLGHHRDEVQGHGGLPRDGRAAARPTRSRIPVPRRRFRERGVRPALTAGRTQPAARPRGSSGTQMRAPAHNDHAVGGEGAELDGKRLHDDVVETLTCSGEPGPRAPRRRRRDPARDRRARRQRSRQAHRLTDQTRESRRGRVTPIRRQRATERICARRPRGCRRGGRDRVSHLGRRRPGWPGWSTRQSLSAAAGLVETVTRAYLTLREMGQIHGRPGASGPCHPGLGVANFGYVRPVTVRWTWQDSWGAPWEGRCS